MTAAQLAHTTDPGRHDLPSPRATQFAARRARFPSGHRVWVRAFGRDFRRGGISMGWVRRCSKHARCVETFTLWHMHLSVPSVREVALEREVEGDLFLQDIGQGFGFRPGSFDGAIRCVRPAITIRFPC